MAHLAVLVAVVLGLSTPLATQAVAPAEADGEFLVVVRVVDPLWMPIPGARVALRSGDGQSIQGVTDLAGMVRLRLPVAESSEVFEVLASMPGFKIARIPAVRFGPCLGRCSESRYLQVQLKGGRASFVQRTG